MSRRPATTTTIRLPDSLHDALKADAKNEGISMNQLIVYILACNTKGPWPMP